MSKPPEAFRSPEAFPSPKAFPWDEVMAFCLGVLRWTPETFWAATPREIAAAARAFAHPGPAAPERDDFAALMAAFPDEAA